MVTFPSDQGTYILLLYLPKAAQLSIGKRGRFDFPAGYYAYVGSAFGTGGLRGRLKHHLSPLQKAHWHIDYLRQAGTIYEVWYIASQTVYEHVWADRLQAMHGASIPVARFGASDCQCRTHLIYFTDKPHLGTWHEASSLLSISLVSE